MKTSKEERFGADYVIVQITMSQDLYRKLATKKTTKRSWRKFLEEELVEKGISNETGT